MDDAEPPLMPMHHQLVPAHLLTPTQAKKRTRKPTKSELARQKWWEENPIGPIARDWGLMRPVGGFNFIMIDPPWAFSSNSIDKPGKNVRRHYETAPIEWIKALPVREALASDHTLIWLWGTNPLLDRAFEVLKAWGFRFTTSGHWAKLTVSGKQFFGTGHTLRGAGEPFLIGKIGNPKTTKSVRSVILGVTREHSRKPEEGFVAAQRLMPWPETRRIEVFSRTDRPGWTTWGNEKGKIPLEAAE